MEKNKGKNNKQMMDIIKENLSDNQKSKLSKLNKDILQNKLNNKKISKISLHFVDDDKTKGLCYFKDCDIISKDLKILFENIDDDIKSKCKKVNCVFHEDKIIIFLDDNILNVSYNYKSSILVEYIIKSNKADLLFDSLLKNGYHFISSYLVSSKTEIPIKNNNQGLDQIPVEIYKLPWKKQ